MVNLKVLTVKYTQIWGQVERDIIIAMRFLGRAKRMHRS